MSEETRTPFDPPPVDPEQDSHLVLAGPRGRYALWPGFAPVPDGWEAVYGPAPHAACLQYIEPAS